MKFKVGDLVRWRPAPGNDLSLDLGLVVDLDDQTLSLVGVDSFKVLWARGSLSFKYSGWYDQDNVGIELVSWGDNKTKENTDEERR